MTLDNFRNLVDNKVQRNIRIRSRRLCSFLGLTIDKVRTFPIKKPGCANDLVHPRALANSSGRRNLISHRPIAPRAFKHLQQLLREKRDVDGEQASRIR